MLATLTLSGMSGTFKSLSWCRVAGRMVDVLVKRPDDAEQMLWNDLLYLCITFVTASFMTFVR